MPEPRLIASFPWDKARQFFIAWAYIWKNVINSKRTLKSLLLVAMRQGATRYYAAPGMYLIFRQRADGKGWEKGVISPVPKSPNNFESWGVEIWWLGEDVVIPELHDALRIQEHDVFQRKTARPQPPPAPSAQLGLP